MSQTPAPLPVPVLALQEVAAEWATAAGEAILRVRAAGVQVSATKSSSADIVTRADQLAEELLVAAIASRFPEHGILGEEGTSINPDAEIVWIIDPIDGTVNYLYDLPGYCVSVAAAVRDPGDNESYRAVAGAVYSPRTAELFTAAAGHGATCNGAPLKASGKQELVTALIATGFGYTAKRRAEQAALLPTLLPLVRDIRRSGAAAYDLCLVAAGRLDGYYEGGLKPWDYAAGLLIAREAGAAVTGSKAHHKKPGSPLIIAGSPTVVTQLAPLVDV